MALPEGFHAQSDHMAASSQAWSVRTDIYYDDESTG
jgi:hypothetical protein